MMRRRAPHATSGTGNGGADSAFVLRELQFRSRRAFTRAFEQLVMDPAVETCLADPSTLTLRFKGGDVPLEHR